MLCISLFLKDFRGHHKIQQYDSFYFDPMNQTKQTNNEGVLQVYITNRSIAMISLSMSMKTKRFTPFIVDLLGVTLTVDTEENTDY